MTIVIRGHFKCPRPALSAIIVQELCESRGGRPGLSVLTSLLVSVDVKIYGTMLRLTSEDIKHHFIINCPQMCYFWREVEVV